MRLKINEDFRSLIPSLTDDEFEKLEASCLSEGIRDALVTWNGVIIDGHNRYEIAQKHNLPFDTKELDFANEFAVKEWMIVNQLGRRNLTKEQKDYLIGQRYNNEKASHGRFSGEKVSHQNDDLISQGKTKQRFAEEYRIGEATVERNSEFAKGADKLTPELKQKVLAGQSGVNKSAVQQIAKAEPFFKATSEKDILDKAKEIRDQRSLEKSQKLEDKKKEIAKILSNEVGDNRPKIYNMDCVSFLKHAAR